MEICDFRLAMGNYNSSQLCPNPECGLYIPHPVGSCARLRQEHEAGQASSFRHPYPRRPHSSYVSEDASQSACNSPSVVTRESVHHHALAGSSSVTSSPYRFRPKPGTTTSNNAVSGYQPQQLHQQRPRASTSGSAEADSPVASPESVNGAVGDEGILSPHSGTSGDVDVDADADAIAKRDPGSSSYVSYHASKGTSICSPRKGIRPSGSSHSLFEDAVDLCQKDEEEIAEANEKRGIVTRGEYFSSSRYSSRRSSAVTTPGEPEEGFCSPRRSFRPPNQNQRSLDGCDIFAAIQALNELKEAGEVDQVHEWVNEQGRIQRRLKKARPGVGIVGPSGEEFCGLATVGEEAKVVDGIDPSSSNLDDEKDSLLLPNRLTLFDSSSGEVRPAGLETDDDVGVILPTDAVELQQSNSSRTMIQSETSSTICRNNTETTLVGADSPEPLRQEEVEGKGGEGATLFSLENDSSAHSDEEPMDCMDTLSMEIRPGETGVVNMSRLPDKGLSSGEPLPNHFPSHAPYSQSPNLFISGGSGSGAPDLFPAPSPAAFPHSVATACGTSNDESSPMMDTSSASSHHSPSMIS